MNGLIDPVVFDVIVLGTGLQESLLAAAASACGLTVLHLDPHEFYGAHWTSLDFKQFSSWATAGGSFTQRPSPITDVTSSSSNLIPDADVGDSVSDSPAVSLAAASLDSSDENPTVDSGLNNTHLGKAPSNGVSGDHQFSLEETEGDSDSAPSGELGLEEIEIELELGRSLYSHVEVCECEGVSLGASRSYNIDLAGPRLTFCGSNLVNLFLRCGASHYMEFKGIDGSYIWTGTEILAVPSSRADVFKDNSLSLPDKRYLMRFFKLVTDHATADDPSSLDISAEDLEGPFLNFLQRQRLPPSIQSIIFYAIALVDEEQRLDGENLGSLLKTREGLQKLALYLSSVARFPNAPGAFLYPLYGQGELPQAFCRSAAVNGTLYVLRQPVNAILVDKDSKEYKGIRTPQGQVLSSKKLIMGPSLMPKSGHDRLNELANERSSPAGELHHSGHQVARCVCITDTSISVGQSTLLVIFPPRSINERITSVVRALQLSSAASVCPDGKFLVQLSTICTDPVDGREVLTAAVDALFSGSGTGNSGTKEADNGVDEPIKPKLLWSVYYVQTLHTPAENLTIPGVAICAMPDGSLDGEAFLASTEKLFTNLFPDKEYFPRASEPEDAPDDQDAE